MKFDACIEKITKYLESENVQPLLVNVQNSTDLDKLITHFNVDENYVIHASEFCNKDELPRIESLLDYVSMGKKKYFLVGLTSFLRFDGEDEVEKVLATIVNMNIIGHLVVITYQCDKHLEFSDPRLSHRICLLDGEKTPLPKLIFVSQNYSNSRIEHIVDGIDSVADIIENGKETEIFVFTNKNKSMYHKSSYAITDISRAYQLVISKDSSLLSLDEEIGTESQWKYLQSLLTQGKNFAEICTREFGNYQSLEIAVPNYNRYSDDEKWLYFIALKMFGAKNNDCLAIASQNAVSHTQLIREVYRSILIKDFNDEDFDTFYQQRKKILMEFNSPMTEVLDFFKIIKLKEEKAIYYLTDNTQLEKEYIIELLDKYYQEVEKNEIEKILCVVYPDLYYYLMDYKYDNIPLLDKYFSLYTHSKVINKILPELKKLVIEQAIRREYNLILEPRSVKLDSIDKSESQIYFMDALGMEYLSYIFAKCSEKELLALITPCTANLPSITSKNNEFIAEFEAQGILVTPDKKLDDIKHKGIRDSDYQKTKLPIHLIEELKIIDEALNHIKLQLTQERCKKVIIVSDHGSSRMAVINETENMWEMVEKGKYSGRCCPKSDMDIQSEFATEENGFWVLANYDRFKGSRKADVEVHGGATLEEVVIPIIEIMQMPKDIEVAIIEPVITIGYKKKAKIQLFINPKLDNVTVKLNGKHYEAKLQNDSTYIVDLPHLKKSKKYIVDVFASNNRIGSSLTFEIKKEGIQEKKLF